MGVKVTNNAFGTLSASISTSDTTITLDSGQGARFPSLGAGDYFYGTLVDTSNNIEVVKVTARSTDSMTVTRGADNTTATAFAIGDRFELRPTAALFESIIAEVAVDGITSSATGTAITIDSSDDTTIENDLIVDGKAGIGTSSLSYKLHVLDGTGSLSSTKDITAEIKREDGTYNPRLQIRHSTDGTDINHTYTTTSSNLTFSNGSTERMRIDSSGRVTMPYQPAFSAYPTTAFSGPGIIPFAATQVNRGSHFNTSTYRFTAPVAGAYFFHYDNNHDGAPGGGSALYADWYKNGSNLGRHRMYTYFNGGWEELSGSMIIELAVNDYIQVYLVSSHRADGGSYGCFAGHLIG